MATLVERGKHLVLTAACNDCHTPFKLGPNGPEPDMARQLSGHPEAAELTPAPKPSGPWIVSASATNTAWAGPWGISHTSNLTPDRDTGLGAWTEDDFVQTIQSGRHLGRGRALLPPMPTPAYQNFTTDEIKAIYAYLRSIPAIRNQVPEPVVPSSASL
jgi:mono/diheme cytochrome c family protein